MSRHAYLILSYAQPRLLEHLIHALDDSRNDIFVHIDKKAAFDGTLLVARYSSLIVIDPIDARWGDVSLVEVEMKLIEAALSHGRYSYLHFLSDSDYPIKTQDYIHAECARLAGMEFVGYAIENNRRKEILDKVQYYYLFPHQFRSSSIIIKGLRYLHLRAQKMLGLHRNTDIDFKRGSQWCSITYAFAQYVISNRQMLLHTYNHTYCPDELFMQTLCWSSPFRKKLFSADDEFEGCKRYVNWHGPNLLWLGLDDIDDMLSSNRWFARKFTEKNMEVIRHIDKRLNH